MSDATGVWEAVVDEDGKGGSNEFWRVRYSLPDFKGRYLYVRHYGSNGSAWNRSAAESQAREFNAEGKSPYHFSTDYRREVV